MWTWKPSLYFTSADPPSFLHVIRNFGYEFIFRENSFPWKIHIQHLVREAAQATLKPIKSESLGVRSRNQYFIKQSGWFQCVFEVDTTAYSEYQLTSAFPIFVRHLHSASAPSPKSVFSFGTYRFHFFIFRLDTLWGRFFYFGKICIT